MFYRIALFVFGAIFTITAQAQIYRWTDSKGRQHVTDAPPPRNAKESKFIDAGEGQRKKRRTAKRRPTHVSKNFKYFTVMLYTNQECGQECDLARTLLKERGIVYSEKVIKDELDEEWLIKQVGENTLPSITVGNDVYKGWSEEAWHALLDRAGFPKPVQSAENQDPQEFNSEMDKEATQNASPVLENTPTQESNSSSETTSSATDESKSIASSKQ